MVNETKHGKELMDMVVKMNKVYNTELHKFVEAYLKSKDARIERKHNDFFEVIYENGERAAYTYSARIASEGNNIGLIAKGSKILKAMISECTGKAAYSSVSISYNESTLKSSLAPKSCCSLCPFISVCEHKCGCCDFCSYYKSCNTNISNAQFSKLGNLVSSTPVKIMCFIFTLELSDDYTLSQKIEKDIVVLIDIEREKTLENILVKDILKLELKPWANSKKISTEKYRHFLNLAKSRASDVLSGQLEVFKKVIERPLVEKIKSIVSKYQGEYIENYTKTSLEELDSLQEEALTLCKREIRGYTINTDIKLKNLILINTRRDKRKLVFTRCKEQKDFEVNAEIFLSRVDIYCDECGSEIDISALCSNGHILCSSCYESCNSCDNIICSICDDESFICSTCGEIHCLSCSKTCDVCGAVICPDHSYECSECGKLLCFDCHEICSICDLAICSSHSSCCSECGKHICSEHQRKCSVCGESYCDEHIRQCQVCKTYLCSNHTGKSEFSKRHVCHAHLKTCTFCKNEIASDEVHYCSSCNAPMCPDDTLECKNCMKEYCRNHVSHCKCCGRSYCSCETPVKCRLCGEEYCSDCVSLRGYCKCCGNLKSVKADSEIISKLIDQIPQLSKYKRFYLGISQEIKTVYAKSLFKRYLVVMDSSYNILGKRRLTFLESMSLGKKQKGD